MDGNSVNPDVCVFCMKKVDGDRKTYAILTEKGIEGIIKASSQRCDTIAIKEGNKVHKKCREKYTNLKEIALSQKNASVQQHEEDNP